MLERRDPLKVDNSIDLFTQREDMDIDFECLDCHMQLWNKPKILVFVNSWRWSRVTLFDYRDLQADLQQNNAYNPFSEETKVIIRELGNVELFELCETIPKLQCSESLLSWNQGIVYCTCGHLLKKWIQPKFTIGDLDAFSIPHYVIRMVRPRGARHGRTEELKEHFITHNARRRCIKKNFGLHDRLYIYILSIVRGVREIS